MSFRLLILLFSVAAFAASVFWVGPVVRTATLVPMGLVLVALIWVIAGVFAPRRDWILVDGSNVLYWRNDTPDLATVRLVVRELLRRDLTPVVWFDANAGYLVAGRYFGPGALARQLGIPAAQVFVAPKGTPADPLILEGAQALSARVVTNDRYRDWADTFPALGLPEVLVRGQIRDGKAILTPVGTQAARVSA